MLDHDHAVPRVAQPLEVGHQALDVGGVQSGGRLVEDVQGGAALAALQLGGELDPLGLTPRELGRGLAEAEVTDADLLQRRERPRDRGLVGEHLGRGVDGERQDVGDRAAAVGDLERLGVVARAVARRAGRVDAGQEQQLDHDRALALAGRAAPLGHVEREPAGVVAAGAGGLGLGEQLAHVVEQPGVGGEVRARRATDRLLVDAHQAAHEREVARERAARRERGVALEVGPLLGRALVGAGGRSVSLAEVLEDQLDQGLADQARLARAGDPGDRRQHAERQVDVEVAQVVAGDPAQAQPPARLARRGPRSARLREQVARGLRALHRGQAGRRARVEQAAAVGPRAGAEVDEPVGVADHVELVLDHEQRVARRLEPVERAQQRLGVGGVQPGRGLVEHVHHPEQVGVDLRGEAQPLQLAGRQRGRAALDREVAQAEVEQHREPRQQLVHDPPRRERPRPLEPALPRVLAQQLRQPREREPRQLGDVEAGERDRERLAAQALAAALGAVGADQEPRRAPLHARALAGRERVQHPAPGAGERALVARLLLAPPGALHLVEVVAGPHRHGRLLVGEQDPVAQLARQLAPGAVHVVAQRGEDVAQVLPVPGGRPGRDRALADRERVVGHHGALGRVVDPAQPVAGRAGPLGRVGRELVGVELRLPARVAAGARVEHAQQVGEGGHAPDRRARGRRAALLLQRHRGRERLDRVHLGHGHLVEQPPRVGRDRLEVAPLSLGVQRAERERRLARARDAGEHHQRVARDRDVEVLEVVLARAAHAHEAARVGVGWWLHAA